jgi:hypothetical protein
MACHGSDKNMSEIRQQRQICYDQVKQMRVKINSHLDRLEHNFLKELDDAEDKIKSKIDNILKQLSEESKTVEGIQSDTTAIKEYASLAILYLIFVKLCSISSSNVDVFDVLIISRIDKSSAQSLWFVEIQSGQHGLSWT